MQEQEKLEHTRLQKSYFDERADIFKLPIPDDVQERTRSIIAAARLTENSRVLDVATGTGVLIQHILEAAVPASNIVGCDLCETMLSEARTRYPSISFWLGDFIDFPLDRGPFDAIFFNACFGNFLDQESVIEHAASLLAAGGRIVISHPMGARFVEGLHDHEPEIVPHLLPERETLEALSTQFALSLEFFQSEPKLYIAVLRRLA